MISIAAVVASLGVSLGVNVGDVFAVSGIPDPARNEAIQTKGVQANQVKGTHENEVK